jgi:hypothetical protein
MYQIFAQEPNYNLAHLTRSLIFPPPHFPTYRRRHTAWQYLAFGVLSLSLAQASSSHFGRKNHRFLTLASPMLLSLCPKRETLSRP